MLYIYFSIFLLIKRFENPESAKHAKEELDDADIYSGCCTLQIEYAKVCILAAF